MLVLAYVTMCRRGELVDLLFSDLTVESDGFGTITIRRGKTDQEGVGAIAPVPADAMRHVQAWIDVAGIRCGQAGAGQAPGSITGGGWGAFSP